MLSQRKAKLSSHYPFTLCLNELKATITAPEGIMATAKVQIACIMLYTKGHNFFNIHIFSLTMTSIEHNLQRVQLRISAAAAQCGRDLKEITLLAVSKTKPASAIEEAMAAGQRCFGENYVQEGVDKIHLLANPALTWHFIGPLQSNKSRLVAEYFDWCHTVDRFRIASRLNDQRPAGLAALNVLIQVNISDEQSKAGIMLADLPALAQQIAEMPRLKLRGLMAIPAPESDYARQLAVCQQMAQAFKQLQQDYPGVDTLSLGMSDDMAAAIAAGSTMVRIGTAIFGARDYGQAAANHNN